LDRIVRRARDLAGGRPQVPHLLLGASIGAQLPIQRQAELFDMAGRTANRA
jgi:hypothetical protein